MEALPLLGAANQPITIDRIVDCGMVPKADGPRKNSEEEGRAGADSRVEMRACTLLLATSSSCTRGTREARSLLAEVSCAESELIDPLCEVTVFCTLMSAARSCTTAAPVERRLEFSASETASSFCTRPSNS